MVQTNVVTFGHADAGEAGRIVDAGGGVAAIRRNLTHGGQRHEVDPDDAAAGIEAALAAAPAGSDVHLYGDGTTPWDISGGSGPGILISKPDTRLFFHSVELTTSGGATRGFVVHAPRCSFVRPWFRSENQSQAAYYAIRFEEHVVNGWDCSGGSVLGGKFELGNGSGTQAAIGAITATGAGSGLQGLWIVGNEFIGLPGTQQTTIPNVGSTFNGYVPVSLSFVESFMVLSNVWRAERLTVDANLTGKISCAAWIRDCRFGIVAANSLQSYQGAAVDLTRGPGFRIERISSAEGHHTIVALNNAENAAFEGLLDLLGARYDVVIGNLVGRCLGSTYGMRSRADSQTGGRGGPVSFVGNETHNVDSPHIRVEDSEDILVAAHAGALMHPGTGLVSKEDGSCSNIHVDENSMQRSFFKKPPS